MGPVTHVLSLRIEYRVASTSSRCRLLTAVALSPFHAALHPVTVSEDPVILTVICHPLTVVLHCCGLRIHSLSSYHPHCHPLTGHPTILTVIHSCHLVNLPGIHSSCHPTTVSSGHPRGPPLTDSLSSSLSCTHCHLFTVILSLCCPHSTHAWTHSLNSPTDYGEAVKRTTER